MPKNPFPHLCTILHSVHLRCCKIPRKCPTVGQSTTVSNTSLEKTIVNCHGGKLTKNGGMHRIMKGLGIFRFMFPCVHCVRHTYRQKWKFPKITLYTVACNVNCLTSQGIFSFHLWYYQILWLKMPSQYCHKWYWKAFF